MKYIKKFNGSLLTESSNTKISKEEYYSIFSDDITKKKYDQIVSKIEDRCNHIVRNLIAKPQNCKVNWWDFSNMPENRDDGDGYFDANKGDKTIEFTGEYSDYNAVFLSDGEFPVEFIWMDDSDVIKEVKSISDKILKEKEEKKLRRKSKREESKKTREEVINKIKSKLTEEEIKFLKI